MRPFVIALSGVACLAACDREGVLEVDADALSVGPVQELAVYVSGFHYVADDPALQMEVDHYCHRKSDLLIQCVLYDGSGEDTTNLIGIEHIVARSVFDALPDAEKVLWHPHTYEVKSGALVAPDLPLEQEHQLMAELVSTYGKTWHVWDPAVNVQPIDTPRLMKAFTEDGQLDPALLQARDQRLGIDSAARRADRADIIDPGFDPVVLEEFQVCQPLPTPGPDEPAQ